MAELQSLRDKIVASKEEGETIGMTGRQLADLTRQRYYQSAALKDETANAIAAIEPGNDLIQIYRDQAQALRELGDSQADNSVASAFAETASSIESSLTDALMRGFESGKDFAETFRDTLKNMFQTLILKPLIQPIMGAVAGTIAGVVSGTSAAGGGVGSMGMSLAGSAIGSMFGAGGLTGALMGGAGWLTGATTLGGSLAAAGSLMGTGTLAGAMSGAAMGIGAIAPIALPLLALSGVFKKKPSNRAAWGDVDLSSGMLSSLGNMTGDKQASQETMDARTALLQALGGFGQSAGAAGKIRIDVGGRDGIQAAFDGGALESFGKDFDSALMGILDRIVESATVDQTVIARWQVLKTSLDGTSKAATDMAEIMTLLVNDVSMVDIERANLIKAENESIGQSYARLADMMGTAMDSGEMWRAAQKRLADQFDELGLTVPRSSEQFGDLLQSIDITTEAGRQLFQSLANVGDEFLFVARAVEAAMAQIAQSTEASIRDIQLSLLDERGKYGFLDKEIAAGMDALTNAVSPDEIARIAEENRALLMDAWNLVPESLRASLADQFIGLLEENQQLANDRLTTVSPDAVSPDTSADDKAFEEAITNALTAAAQNVSDGGEQVLSAAELIARAVGGLPDRIVIENRVSVTVPEVGR